jgi:hypothetical protein
MIETVCDQLYWHQFMHDELIAMNILYIHCVDYRIYCIDRSRVDSSASIVTPLSA